MSTRAISLHGIPIAPDPLPTPPSYVTEDDIRRYFIEREAEHEKRRVRGWDMEYVRPVVTSITTTTPPEPSDCYVQGLGDATGTLQGFWEDASQTVLPSPYDDAHYVFFSYDDEDDDSI